MGAPAAGFDCPGKSIFVCFYSGGSSFKIKLYNLYKKYGISRLISKYDKYNENK